MPGIRTLREPPAAVAELMAGFLALPGHEFWPDDLTLFNSRRIHRARLLDSAQVTDSYLLALAATHGGQLTTFDRHLVPDAVVKGPQSLGSRFWIEGVP